MKSLILALVLFAAPVTQAAPALSNVSSQDFEDISKEMSANFTHNSMLGAAKMGTLLGVQVGLVAASTSTPKTNDIVKRNADAELSNIYNAGLLVSVGIPFGIAFEGVLLPETKASGASFSVTSLAVKYNMNDLIPILPLNLALRGFYSTANFKFNQTISSVDSSVENKTSISGLQILLSPMTPLIDPYVGIGLLNASNTLEASGSAIFDPSYTTSQSETKNISGTQFLAGVDLNLLLFKIGAEYSQAFGTSKYGLKLAVGF
ncbi:MAG: hypothetical protein HUU57_12220 [Bdellovibrio sp.]|nr:hypothetical protein [Bdellovibrio sp.]